MDSKVQSKRDVLERLEALRGELADLGVARLGLFGSFQRDTAGVESDVDLLVEFRDGEKTYQHLFEINSLLERELGRSVELVTPVSLRGRMRESVLEEVEYVEGLADTSRAHRG
ncbi:MAG: nucleotidyltransferase family protein [Bradymonadaceae bacterium]